MRIVKTRSKVLYIAAWFVGITALGLLLEAVRAEAASDWVSTIGFVGLTVTAVRMFRVAEEDVAAPRPLWRMTGRPTAGFLLGGLNVLSAVGAIWAIVATRVTHSSSDYSDAFAAGGSVAVQVVSIIVDAFFGVWYLRSSILLVRRAPKPVTVTL